MNSTNQSFNQLVNTLEKILQFADIPLLMISVNPFFSGLEDDVEDPI